MAVSRPSRFPAVPYALIRMMVGNLSAALPDAEVASDIEKRMRRLKLNGIARKTPRGLSEREIKEAVRWGLQVHADNRKMYYAVVRGML